MSVIGPGTIVTRGLGSSALVTRGYNPSTSIIIIDDVTLPVFPNKARLVGHRRKDDEIDQVLKYVVKATLISINDDEITNPIEHVTRANFDPSKHPGARLIDVEIEALHDTVSISAQLESISRSSQVFISANIPTVNVQDENIIVRAGIDSIEKVSDDIFILVKHVNVREENDD